MNRYHQCQPSAPQLATKDQYSGRSLTSFIYSSPYMENSRIHLGMLFRELGASVSSSSFVTPNFLGYCSHSCDDESLCHGFYLDARVDRLNVIPYVPYLKHQINKPPFVVPKRRQHLIKTFSRTKTVEAATRTHKTNVLYSTSVLRRQTYI